MANDAVQGLLLSMLVFVNAGILWFMNKALVEQANLLNRMALITDMLKEQDRCQHRLLNELRAILVDFKARRAEKIDE